MWKHWFCVIQPLLILSPFSFKSTNLEPLISNTKSYHLDPNTLNPNFRPQALTSDLKKNLKVLTLNSKTPKIKLIT
jgi:hypothetical protein